MGRKRQTRWIRFRRKFNNSRRRSIHNCPECGKPSLLITIYRDQDLIKCSCATCKLYDEIMFDLGMPYATDTIDGYAILIDRYYTAKQAWLESIQVEKVTAPKPYMPTPDYILEEKRYL